MPSRPAIPPAADRPRLVGWTEIHVAAPGSAGRPDETDYYVAVTVDDPTEPFLTVGRMPPLARLRRWLAGRLGLSPRLVPDPYVSAPASVERIVADRIAAGLDPAAVAERTAEEERVIAAGRFDDAVAARNRALPVGHCVVAAVEDGFDVGYGWYDTYR